MTNRLPKYWVVKCDDSELFRSTVIKYLNATYGSSKKGNSEGQYYGTARMYHSDKVYADNFCDISSFNTRPTVLTIDEFIKLTTEVPKPEVITNYRIW